VTAENHPFPGETQTQDPASQLRKDLNNYCEMVRRWSDAVNLFSRKDGGALLNRLVSQSLSGLPWIEDKAVILDVGSGNGIPIIPILLANRNLRGVLTEPRERRWAFLKEVVRELRLNAEVRRERLHQHKGKEYDLITVRAVSPSVWLGGAAALLREGGRILWWTGLEDLDGVGETPGLERVITCKPSDQEPAGLVIWRRCST
jgi:16S rRNA (guanine(527)-N(7))-methyltransferase RsmG